MDVEALAALLQDKRWLALTGAGISTESGIPDYRGPQTRTKLRNPIQHRAFLADPRVRARYWSRSVLGWPRFRAFQPNPGHQALAALQRAGRVTGVLTQNVDRLHQKAGAEEVLELHGSLYQVRCLGCGAEDDRDALQLRLLEQNPAAQRWPYQLAPDGDADIPEEAIERFVVPDCEVCGGVLKPDVVFFGDNVPLPRVEAAFAAVEQAQALVVIGSSLAIWSGYRFALRASERKLPVAILNLGETRADHLAALCVDAPAGTALPRLAQLLDAPIGSLRRSDTRTAAGP